MRGYRRREDGQALCDTFFPGVIFADAVSDFPGHVAVEDGRALVAADEGEACVVFGDEFGKVLCIVEFSEWDGVDSFAEPVDCLPFAYASHGDSPLSCVCLWYKGHTTHKTAEVKPWCRRWRSQETEGTTGEKFFCMQKNFSPAWGLTSVGVELP